MLNPNVLIQDGLWVDPPQLFRVCATVGAASVEFLADRDGWQGQLDHEDPRYFAEGQQNDDSTEYLQELFVRHEADWLAMWLKASFPGITDVRIYPEDLPICGYYEVKDADTLRIYRGDEPNGLPYSIAALILPQPEDPDPDETYMREFFASRGSLPPGWKVLEGDA